MAVNGPAVGWHDDGAARPDRGIVTRHDLLGTVPSGPA